MQRSCPTELTLAPKESPPVVAKEVTSDGSKMAELTSQEPWHEIGGCTTAAWTEYKLGAVILYLPLLPPLH